MRRPRAMPALLGSLGVALALGGACGDDAPSFATRTRAPAGSSPGPGQATVTPLPGGSPVSYPDTSEGLGQLGRDLLAAAHGRDEARMARLLESLRLRDPAAWFEKSFGKTLGVEVATEYAIVRDEIGQLAAVLEKIAAAGQTKLTIERFEQPDLPASVGYQSAALAKMAHRSPLYSLRFGSADGEKLYHLWSFVHQDGSFRYVGKMKRLIETPPSGGRDLLELRLADADRIRPGD